MSHACTPSMHADTRNGQRHGTALPGNPANRAWLPSTQQMLVSMAAGRLQRCRKIGSSSHNPCPPSSTPAGSLVSVSSLACPSSKNYVWNHSITGDFNYHAAAHHAILLCPIARCRCGGAAARRPYARSAAVTAAATNVGLAAAAAAAVVARGIRVHRIFRGGSRSRRRRVGRQERYVITAPARSFLASGLQSRFSSFLLQAVLGWTFIITTMAATAVITVRYLACSSDIVFVRCLLQARAALVVCCLP